MRLSHTLARTSAVFDDPNLVSHGGLVPVVAPVSGHSGRVLPVAFPRERDGWYGSGSRAGCFTGDCRGRPTACNTRTIYPAAGDPGESQCVWNEFFAPGN